MKKNLLYLLKFLLSLLLIIVLIFSLNACKKKNKSRIIKNNEAVSDYVPDISTESNEKITETINIDGIGEVIFTHSPNSSIDTFKNNKYSTGDTLIIGDFKYVVQKKWNGKEYETLPEGSLGCFSVIAITQKEKYEDPPYEVLFGLKVLNYDYCFYNNNILKEIPRMNKELVSASHCFDGCTNLTNETINDTFCSLNNIEDVSYMFANCELLKNFGSIPQTVKNADGMFLNCKNLESLVFSSNAEKLNETFKGCKNLSGNILFNSVPKEYKDTFTDTVKEIKVKADYDNLSMFSTYSNVKCE